MQNVIIIGPAHPLRGGLASYNERLAREFQNHGYKVLIETFRLQYPSLLFPGKTQYSSEPKPDNVSINESINSINPLNWFITGSKLKNKKPDLVIVRYWLPFMAPCLGTICRLIRSNKHSKIISILDNIIPHEKRIADQGLSGFFIKSVDGFITMSESVLNELSLFNKTKPRSFCPHPLYDNYGKIISKDEALKNLDLDTKSKYILFFGFIRDYKGLDIAIKAMNNDQIKKWNIKLIVAGEFYTDPKPYFQLIKDHKLHNQVIMSNEFIPNSKVAAYFCASDIVVQPYKSATQSGVTQIAYHFNKPMIVTNVGGLPEIVHHNKTGYVVNINPDEISKSIIRFYADNRKEKFTNNVKKEKDKYSWDRMVNTIKELYNNIA